MEPIIVDVGKRGKKALKALKRGQGDLTEAIESVLAENALKTGNGSRANELPVIFLYEKPKKKKKKKRKNRRALTPLDFLVPWIR